MRADDLERLMAVTAATNFFLPDELAVAREVLTEAASGGESSGYLVYVAASEDTPLGYVCFGPAPMTRHTWNIYWMAVNPRNQRRGIGARLMSLSEAEIYKRRGRLILLETSSRDLYSPTREFHLSMGYQEIGRIPDYYDVGDDKITYAKVLLTEGDAGWSGSQATSRPIAQSSHY